MISILYASLKLCDTKEIKEQAVIFEGMIEEYKWNEETNNVNLTIRNKKETFLVKVKNASRYRQIIEYGNKITGKGNIKIPLPNTIPNLFNYKQFLQSESIFYIIESDTINLKEKGNILWRIKQKIRDSLNQRKQKYYYKMLLLGIKETENFELEESFRHNGISHIFAISGMHLAAIYKIFEIISKKIFKNKIFSILYPFCMISLYYLLISKSISSQRAYFYFLLVTLNGLGNVNLSNKKIFLFNLGFTFLRNPYAIYQVAFWYSYVVSFSLIFFSRTKKEKGYKLKNACFIFLVTIPITINCTFEINPWIIVNNFILVPVITIQLFPVLLLSLIFPFLETISQVLIILIEQGNLWLSHLPFSNINMSKIPFSLLLFYYFITYASFSFQKYKFVSLLSILLLLNLNLGKFNPNGYLYFLDIGQGDCALIISPYQKEIILIDTGMKSTTNQKNILLFLKSIGIAHLDYLIITHGDLDHIGNALGLLENIKINQIILNAGEENQEEFKISTNYKSKIRETVKLKNIKINELSHAFATNENDNSRIYNLCIYNTCTIFMGDASSEVEKEIQKKYLGQADILKVAHHGSDTSTSTSFLKTFHFKDAIISAGRNNRYHHPHEIVLNRLKKENINIWSTKEKGTIKIKISKKGYTISQNIP